MKEVESLKLQPDTELVSPVEQKKRFKHLGSTPMNKSMKMWEVDIATLEITEAEIKDHQVMTPQKTFVNKKALITKAGKIYVPALNKKNGLRKGKEHIKKHNLKATVANAE
jgi:hypothetical protein